MNGAFCEVCAGDGGEGLEKVEREARAATDGAGSADAFDFGWGAFTDDAAFVDDDDAMGEGVGLFEIMGSEEDGFALLCEVADLVPECATGFDVEADGGLVEEDEVGVAAQGEGEEDTLLLAAAELAEGPVFDALKLGDAEDVGYWKRVRVVAAKEVEMFADAEGLEDAGDLKHGSDAGAGCGFSGVAAEDVADARGWGDEAEEDFDGGGFACAVRAEERDDLTGAESEAEAVEGAGGAVVLGDVGEGCDGWQRGYGGLGDFGLVG